MSTSLLRWLDVLAHVLYVPTALGRRAVRARWHHRIHLIPGRLMQAVCDRYERALAVPDDGFYEDDEPVENVIAAFERSQPYPTRVYGCQHVTIAGPIVGVPTSYCGCELLPV